MAAHDGLARIGALVRDRMRLALSDKAAFERDGQRLNSQLMQGELNMGTAVLGWLARIESDADQDVTDDADVQPEE